MYTSVTFRDRLKPRNLTSTNETTGYQRTASLFYLWRLPLDERDSQIYRTYNTELNETCFTVSGLPDGPRLSRVSNKGFGIQFFKDKFIDNGKSLQLFLRGKSCTAPSGKLISFHPTN
jgi:hypothetical protein